MKNKYPKSDNYNPNLAPNYLKNILDKSISETNSETNSYKSKNTERSPSEYCNRSEISTCDSYCQNNSNIYPRKYNEPTKYRNHVDTSSSNNQTEYTYRTAPSQPSTVINKNVIHNQPNYRCQTVIPDPPTVCRDSLSEILDTDCFVDKDGYGDVNYNWGSAQFLDYECNQNNNSPNYMTHCPSFYQPRRRLNQKYYKEKNGGWFNEF